MNPFPHIASGLLVITATTGVDAVVDTMEYCIPGQPRSETETCLVDGDTFWLFGEKIRLRDFDTPEPRVHLCGGDFERALADRASARLLELLNTNRWEIEYFGLGKNKRRLATVTINGRDVGDFLIEERLARKWPDGEEWWCR